MTEIVCVNSSDMFDFANVTERLGDALSSLEAGVRSITNELGHGMLSCPRYNDASARIGSSLNKIREQMKYINDVNKDINERALIILELEGHQG